MVDYNNFAKTFSKSRKNMKWPEVEYFFSCEKPESILDIWCWSGRLLESYQAYFWSLPAEYLGVDMSLWLIQEAQESFPEHDFIVCDMRQLDLGRDARFSSIFLIASFHHLSEWEQREAVLKKLSTLLKTGGVIYMTNWALDSNFNRSKYAECKIKKSENSFGSSDYTIMFWESQRYYHCFSLTELEYLWEKAGLKILENRVFEGDRNIVTILKK